MIAHPPPLALMLLWPLLLDFRDGGLEKVVGGLRSVCGELLWFPLLRDFAQIAIDFADGAGFFPSLATCGLLDGLIGLPAAFGEDPTATTNRLDEQNLFAIARQGDYAGDETFALGAVSFIDVESVKSHRVL